jgi:hypothetical protein
MRIAASEGPHASSASATASPTAKAVPPKAPPPPIPRCWSASSTCYFGGQFSCLNRGKSKDNTRRGVTRIITVLDVTPSGDGLLLMEGTNDALYDWMFTETEPNLRSMLLNAKGRGMDTIIATIPPVIVSKYRNRQAQHDRIRAFNPRISTIASATGSASPASTNASPPCAAGRTP